MRGVLSKFYLTFLIFLLLRNISWYYFWRQISKVFTKLNPVSTLDRFSYFLDHIADNRWRNQKVTSWLLNHRRIIIDKSANFYNTQLHTGHCVAFDDDWLQFVYNFSCLFTILQKIYWLLDSNAFWLYQNMITNELKDVLIVNYRK